MNQFEYIGTKVLKSEFDFTRVKKGIQFSGDADISAAVGAPKDLEKDRGIWCIVDFSLGGKDDIIQIKMKTSSEFSIKVLEDSTKIQEDAAKVCLRQALNEMSAVLNELVELHIGKKISIPIPTTFE